MVQRAKIILLAAWGRTMKLQTDWTHDGKSCAFGENGSSSSVWRAWKIVIDRGAPGLSPPDLVVQIKAMACELPENMGFLCLAGALQIL